MHESAFPVPEFFDDKLIDCFPGMTKRELFAGLAMAGMLSLDLDNTAQQLAAEAVLAADLLIQELNKPPAQ
ncbi:MAG: hypothetical protein KME07_09520 [Pegethrix bostrychoides GSE-TBD4-15B]|uniref:Uncharacterized protein n=1 Tax=Pegethrix bostrychoides GSE-TBD4-15B TaxID=2839662 RepID=A0A951PA96_9CYAN|nr:hypothetical protein [Pegethrix bostrychoides GSE-TBD4-15B]